MPHLNGKGPNNIGNEEGRKMGFCNDDTSDFSKKIGLGKGFKRHSPFNGKGLGKRLKYYLTNK